MSFKVHEAKALSRDLITDSIWEEILSYFKEAEIKKVKQEHKLSLSFLIFYSLSGEYLKGFIQIKTAEDKYEIEVNKKLADFIASLESDIGKLPLCLN